MALFDDIEVFDHQKVSHVIITVTEAKSPEVLAIRHAGESCQVALGEMSCAGRTDPETFQAVARNRQ